MHNKILKKSLIALVEIPMVLPLGEMAARLESVIGEIRFEEDETGRYEEVPAYVATDYKSCATFILFGIPKDEICDAYTLEFSAETNLSIHEFRETTLKFLSDFLCEKEINLRGYFDYSKEMRNALRLAGIRSDISIFPT